MASLRENTLARTPLFVSLAPREIEALSDLAVEKHFSSGQRLFHEGDPCEGLFVLGAGSVKIFKTSPSGREILLAIETAPGSVAEVPLFDGGAYPASVGAIEDVTAYLIRKESFQRVCHQHPEVPLKVLAVVGKRLRQLVTLIESVTFGSVRQRLARALLEFSQQAGSPSFALPVTHEELALRLGTVREVVSRNLSRFQAEGLLRVSRREIHLLNLPGLHQEAETEL